MKKIIVYTITVALSLSVNAQKNLFQVTPHALVAGDTVKAVQINASTNNLDSITSVQVIMLVYSSPKNQPERLSRQFKYPVGTFSHLPALKSEIVAKVEQELGITITN